MSALIWYLDRATAIVAYPALYAAVVSGVLFNTPAFGVLHRVARKHHITVSMFATIMLLVHGILGVVDSWLVVSGQVPAPSYSLTYFIAGSLVGVTALCIIIVAVMGFLDPRRFTRPWTPRVVHAFAYGGYVFATIHTAAIGSDVGFTERLMLLSGLGFIAYLLVLRMAVLADVTVFPERSA